MRPRVLLSAFACRPHWGSEQGIGWNTAVALAEQGAEVWVLTRSRYRASIEQELASRPRSNLHFLYYDAWLSHQRFGQQLRYLGWQYGVLRFAREAHERHHFDVAHHISYVRHWSPSLLALLPIPFVWGPIGGAEPTRFDVGFGLRSTLMEAWRALAIATAWVNPFVHLTARRAAIALAASHETKRAAERLGCRDVRLMSPVGTPTDTLERGAGRTPRAAGDGGDAVHFASVTGSGRLIHWKGVHLAIRGLARAGLPNAHLHVFGTGPEEARLRRLAASLGVGEQVRFWGDVSRDTMLNVLETSHALVHPAVHDPGATVIPEAMALGVPAIVLATGGPGILVDDGVTGLHAPFGPRSVCAEGIGVAMRRIATEEGLRDRMRDHCLEAARERFSWRARSRRYACVHEAAIRSWSASSKRAVVDAGVGLEGEAAGGLADGAAFGVARQIGELVARHGVTEFAFDEPGD